MAAGSRYQPGDDYTVQEDHTFTAVWEKDEPADEPADDQDPEEPDDTTKPKDRDNTKKTVDKGVSTGDESPLLFWLLVLLMTTGTVGTLAAVRR